MLRLLRDMNMHKTIATAAAFACALQSAAAVAADAAVCANLGSGSSGPSVMQSVLTVGAKAMLEDEVMLLVTPQNGNCLSGGITFKGARGKAAIPYAAANLCGSPTPSTLSLNTVGRGISGGQRLYTGSVQSDGSTVYIGRVSLTSPTASSYDFKLVYKAPFNFTSACTAKVDSTGVSVLWNGQ